jgi:predicted RNA-binding Zn-ribbon protein involved in translation (DUF1610 family)
VLAGESLAAASMTVVVHKGVVVSFESFIERMGFEGDPFAFTNAEQEERLSDYFVPPPYFEAVIGTPSTPKTNVIFAPRGSGKTAQRLMIERSAAQGESPILCLTYDNFAAVQKAGGKIAAHHLELVRLLTMGVLARLESDAIDAIFLDDHERQLVKVAAQRFVGGLTLGEYEQAVKAVKTLGDKAGEFWRKYGGVVAAGVALLMKKAGLDDVSISPSLQAQAGENTDASVLYFFTSLVAIARKLDFEAVYFLVDKVDETPSTTTNAAAAGKLIAELVTDLPTLEKPGVAFKFFFWDQMREYLVSTGLRGDRMEVVALGWTPRELSQMLARRLRSYSAHRVESFNALVSSDAGIDVHLLLVHLSKGSPRDMIRMARTIVTEHTRMGSEAEHIKLSTVYRGIQLYSKQRTEESYPQYQSDFSRVNEPSYTLTGLAGVFKISSQGVANKTQAWTAAGAVRALGTKANPGKKPLNLYGFTDLRIVLASKQPGEVELAIDNYSLECPACEELVVVGESEFDCPNCGERVRVGAARSLLDVCTIAIA